MGSEETFVQRVQDQPLADWFADAPAQSMLEVIGRVWPRSAACFRNTPIAKLERIRISSGLFVFTAAAISAATPGQSCSPALGVELPFFVLKYIDPIPKVYQFSPL